MAADSRYGDLLVRSGALSSEQLQSAKTTFPTNGIHLSEHLSESGVLDQASQVQAIGKLLNLTPVNLEHLAADEMALARIPGALALEHLVVPIELMPGERGELLQIAMVDPSSTAAIRALSAASRCLLRPVVAPVSQVRGAIERLYGLRRQSGGPAPRKVAPSVAPPSPSVVSATQPRATADTAGFSDLFTAQTPMPGTASVSTPSVAHSSTAPFNVDRLERALRAGEPASRRLFVKLVQQLAENGLVDVDRLLND